MAERLYSAEARKNFEKRYGKEHGDQVWRATLGKVAEEQAEKMPGGVKTEEVRSYSRFTDGRTVKVPEHVARFGHKRHRHGRGEHPGPCSKACRRGEVDHQGWGRR